MAAGFLSCMYFHCPSCVAATKLFLADDLPHQFPAKLYSFLPEPSSLKKHG